MKAAAAAAFVPLAAAAQGKGAARSNPTVVQIYDASQMQQDVSKDFLIGSRAAWQDINARGGLRGVRIQHTSIEVDGTPASMKAALAQVRDNPACVALSGTAGDPAAAMAMAGLRQEGMAIAHVAPWLQNSTLEVDEGTFPIFAARQEQITHALKSLSLMGVTDIGAIYASQAEYALYREDVERIAAGMKFKLVSWRGSGDLTQLGHRLGQQTPAILLFIGGTPELVQLTHGLEKQARQRYVVALADVNLQTLVQMGAAKGTPVIATQAVPMVTASLPVVRSYREILARLFDEPPTALSLAGFIAARYTFEVLQDIDGALTRQNALLAFQRRTSTDIGGYRIAFSQKRSATYVTQSMLTADGRVVG